MKSAKTQRSSCCAFFSALLLEIFAWGLAVVAITTSFWLAPTREALPGVSHAGLWLSCGVPPADALAPPPPPPSALLDAAAETIQASIRTVKADVASALRTTATDGCTNSRETFADLNGGDYRVTLTVVRALVIVFLGLGVIKVLCAMGAQCTRRTSSKRGSGAAAALLSFAQLSAGWAAWGLFVAIVVRAAEAAAPASGQSVGSLWSWSFWLYTAALALSTLAGFALLCA